MAQRGSYAKGVAKREEILERALDVIAREGYRGASVKEIADAVGLSQAGLLHYFDSKEQLFTEIIRKRDEHDHVDFSVSDGAAGREGLLRVIAHNAQVPGLVELFSRLSVEAADPAHPAHDYFLERSRGLREGIAAATASSLPGGIDPDTLARIVQAVVDGLQLQWLIDPSVDMVGTLEVLLDALSSISAPAGALDEALDGVLDDQRSAATDA